MVAKLPAGQVAQLLDLVVFNKNPGTPEIQAVVRRQLDSITYNSSTATYWTGFGGYSKHDKAPTQSDKLELRKLISSTMNLRHFG